MTHNNGSHSSSPENNIKHLTERINDHHHLELRTFEFTEHNAQDLEQNIDPDNNFFYSINNNCTYYSDEQFNQSITSKDQFSIIHFNSRSLYANFSNIKEYLQTFSQSFSIIAVSETWINTEKGMDFELEGYELRNIDRRNKGGGGVAIYVDKNLSYKVIKSMTTVIDNLLECITIEICEEKKKNIRVSCIYRTPGTNIDTFREWIEGTFAKQNNKVVFICGDFNIDLINPYKHNTTDDFISSMYSMSLFPKITRPTRITLNSATLIDNIYTNELEDKITGGILINDISDHLPVFIIYNYNHTNRKKNNQKEYRRMKSGEAINIFRNELLVQNWEVVYQENNVDNAYEIFLNVFKHLYDKCCPIKEYTRKLKYGNCPWITKGLQKDYKTPARRKMHYTENS